MTASNGSSRDGDPDDGSPDGAGEAVRSHHDWGRDLPSIAVVEAVARAAGRDPSDLDPLYGDVDPDVLDRLVAPGANGDPPDDLRVSWTYMGYAVTVAGDGTVAVRPRTAREDPSGSGPEGSH